MLGYRLGHADDEDRLSPVRIALSDAKQSGHVGTEVGDGPPGCQVAAAWWLCGWAGCASGSVAATLTLTTLAAMHPLYPTTYASCCLCTDLDTLLDGVLTNCLSDTGGASGQEALCSPGAAGAR